MGKGDRFIFRSSVGALGPVSPRACPACGDPINQPLLGMGVGSEWDQAEMFADHLENNVSLAPFTPLSFGACGSPILSGMTRLHRRLEARLSEFLGQEATMLFNRNYSCNNASGFGRRYRMSG